MNSITTINLSFPTSMYTDIKKTAIKERFASVSELVRAAVREFLYPKIKLTENGFTPEFEKEVLRRANDPKEKFVEWDGKTPFTQFVLNHPPKKFDKKSNNDQS